MSQRRAYGTQEGLRDAMLGTWVPVKGGLKGKVRTQRPARTCLWKPRFSA